MQRVEWWSGKGEVVIQGYESSVMRGKFWRPTVQQGAYSKQYLIVYLKFTKRVYCSLNGLSHTHCTYTQQ